jgi:hypothetical protein
MAGNARQRHSEAEIERTARETLQIVGLSGRADDHGFTVRDASWLFLVTVPHREDLHIRHYQYANNHLSRDEARRIAKAISRLPDLLRRPPC